MSKFDIKYIPGISFPNTILNIAKDVCNQCGVELGNTNFRNADKVINANPFTNAEQCREVIKSIAKISFSCGHVWQDNKLYFGFDVVNNVVSEEITSDNYFETEKNNEIKPITVITLRSSEVAASGQSIRNENLIKQYGENELIIEEDYFAFTDTLRQSFLQEANVLFGLTYHPISIDLEGSVYLSFNDVIKITNLNNEVIKTYCLNNTHTYNGVLYNTVSTPALTETEEKYIYKDEDKTKRTKTAIEIDKANKKITEIVEDVSGHETRIAKTETDINGIKNTVSKTTEIVDELSKDVQVYSVDLDTYSIVIPTDGKQYPFEDKSYRVNFYTYFKGKQVNSIVTTASSNEGITCDINSYINLSVKKETKISNLTNEFIINFIYEDEDKNPYTVSKKIVITLGISEIPKSFLNARIDESVKLEESGNNKLKALNKLEGRTEQEVRDGKNLFNINDRLVITNGVTIDSDGWITITGDNTNGTETKFYNFFTNVSNLLKTSTNYNIITEIKKVTGTGYIAHVSHNATSYNSQFTEMKEYSFVNLTSNSIKTDIAKTKSDFSSSQSMLRGFVGFVAGQKGSITFRISVLEDTSVTADTFKYEAYGKAPTPAFPSEVKTVTGDVKLNISNENIFVPELKVDGYNILIANGTRALTDDEYTFVASGSDMYFGQVAWEGESYSKDKGRLYKVKGKSKIYFLLTNELFKNNYITAYDKNKKSLGFVQRATNKGYYTIPSNVEYISFRFGKGGATVGETYKTKVMLSFEEISEYKKYQGEIKPLTLGSLELCKIGDYKDYIYKSNNKWYKHSEIGKAIFDGVNRFFAGKIQQKDGTYAFTMAGENAYRDNSNTTVADMYCNRLLARTKDDLWLSTEGIAFASLGTYYSTLGFVYIKECANMTLAEANEWLKENNLIIYYRLATPTDTEITDTTLIAQLNALAEAQLYEGITNIIITGDNLTPIVDLDYWTWYKGNEGDKGDKGDTGAAGKDGTSTYFYVRYSANSNGNPMTTSPSSTTQYMGVASTTSSTAPTSYSAYTWSKIKGEQGTSGTPGTAGKDGKTTYLHIKYSEDGINFTPADDDFALGEKPSAYIGQYTDFTEADSSNFADYSWYKFTQNIDAELNQMQSDISQNTTDIENKYQDVIGKMDNFATEDNLVAIEQRVETIEKDNSYNINIIKDIQVNGASKVKTETGYTFDNDGLTIEKTGAKVKSKLDEAGLEIKDATGSSDESLLYAGYDEELGETIVKSKNMTVEKYLVIGKYSRMEDFTDSNGNIGTGMFWIGG